MEVGVHHLNLRHLRLVYAIGQEGQLSGAAQRLAITQPAASRTLAEAERLIGEKLFTRSAKGMVPTEVGVILLRHAEALLGQLSSAASDLNAYRAGLSGTVRIGAVTGPAIGYVVPAIQALKREAPKADVSVDVAPSSDLVSGLLRDAYDVVLARVPPDVDPRTLDIRRGRVEEVRILARASHPLAARRGLQYRDLVGQPWIIQKTGMPIRDAIEQAFINRNLPVPEDVIDTASLVFTIGLLRQSDALAAATAEVAELLRGTGQTGLTEINLSEEIILSPYHLIRRRGQVSAPICDRMVRLLTDELSR